MGSRPAPLWCRLLATGRRVTTSLLGVLLMSAAGLKLYGLRLSVAPQSGWPSDLRAQLATVLWELAVGGCLVLAGGSIAAWSCGLLTFLTFAGISGYLGWVGVAHCGCSGAVPASPWLAFAVDVGAVGLLVLLRPSDTVARLTAQMRNLQTWAAVGGVSAAVGTVLLLAPSGSGSLDRLLPAVRDDALVVEPSLLDGGTVPVGAAEEFTVRVTNRSGRVVRLLGAPSTCRCMTVADLPVALSPGDATTLRVYVRFGSSPGTFDHRFRFYVDDGPLLQVTCRVTARVESPVPSPD